MQLDYAVYATSGFRAPTGSNDLTWGLSQTRGGNMIDNNGVPAGGGRVVATFRVGEGNDVTVGGSVMYGTWDPANRFSYLIAGGDAAARIGRTQLRFEYLVRRQTFAPDPAVPYKLLVPASGEDTFEKHGAYLEVERSMTETVTLLARADGLYRAGNLPVASPLAPRAAVFRYTAGGTVAIAPGFRIKASGELWAFSNDVPVHQDLDLAFHLGRGRNVLTAARVSGADGKTGCGRPSASRATRANRDRRAWARSRRRAAARACRSSAPR